MQLTRRSIILGIAITGAAATTASRAQTAFTAGDLAVYRVGTGAAALSSTAAPVFIDEYSPIGTLVQSIALPTTASGNNNPLVASGSAGSEGELSTSVNGEYLLIPGYDGAVGTTGIASTTAANDPREIGEIDAKGNINTSTTLGSTAFSGNNIRSAASVDGTTLFAAGANAGVVSTTAGTALGGTIIANNATNLRQLQIFNNQLYASSSSGSTRLATVGSGVSSNTGQTITNIPGVTSTAPSSPYDFAFATLGSGSSPDTVYVADNSGDIEKFSLSNGSYAETGSIALAGVTGLVEQTIGTTVQLYASTPAGIFSTLDTSGLDGTLSGTATQIATASTNEAFRGVAFVPSVTAAPEPTSAILLLTAGPMLLLQRKRKNITSISADHSTL